MIDSRQNAPLMSLSGIKPAPGMDSGIVFSRSGDALLISCGQGVMRATRAVGCLLEPEPHDRVLLAVLADGSAWVLSVLERSEKSATDQAVIAENIATVRLPANSVLAADSLSLASRDLRCTAENLTLTGSDVRVEGTRVRVEAGLLALGGAVLLRTFETMHTVAKRSSERILHVNHWYAALRERVRGLVDRKAGRMRLESETGLRVRAGQADIKAKTVLDLDAEHIRLG